MLPVRAAEGEIKESRGGSARRGRCAGGRVTKRRRKRKGNGGVRYGDEARESGADQILEKEQHTVHKDGVHCTMSRSCENGTIMDPTSTAFTGHAAK